MIDLIFVCCWWIWIQLWSKPCCNLVSNTVEHWANSKFILNGRLLALLLDVSSPKCCPRFTFSPGYYLTFYFNFWYYATNFNNYSCDSWFLRFFTANQTRLSDVPNRCDALHVVCWYPVSEGRWLIDGALGVITDVVEYQWCLQTCRVEPSSLQYQVINVIFHYIFIINQCFF